ncbi:MULTISPECIES: DUF5134 domain-containing protein [unclassified Streptomyces]|uniref:DUF5134 domain-containing protein n=1 Tax=unclassified Streptomyces TaxID=2593676 RepID=UPI002E2A5BF5|nr:DUF5134 domain-containing protein [Streptomyces sp. NBC_00228]
MTDASRRPGVGGFVIAASGLRWILSLMFAMPVLYGVWRMVLPATGLAERADHLWHAAMGVLMIAMAWPWGMDLAALPQVVLFSVGGLWFLAAAPFRTGDRTRRRAVLAALPHVVMMGAMAWMVAAMESSGGMSGHTEAAGAHDMAGMDMSGSSGLAAMSLTGTGPRVTAVLFAVVLGGLGLSWLTHALDRTRERGTVSEREQPDGGAALEAVSQGGALSPACHAAMALGMAVMFALLV